MELFEQEIKEEVTEVITEEVVVDGENTTAEEQSTDASSVEPTVETPVETPEAAAAEGDAAEENTEEKEEKAAGDGRSENGNELVRVVGVRFRTAGRVYYFGVGDLPIKRGSAVIAMTARGTEYGTAVSAPMDLPRKKCKTPLKNIVRLATDEDKSKQEANRVREREAFYTCQAKIRQHNLDMKLIDAEYTFDNSKIMFYFTADGRVDFRDLVKDLAGIFHTRIELRQIGVRDETKILGGYGSCGRPLCCHSYLSDFVPVSIKMAKEQNLSLNPTKISGVCGRLMCCLKNEEDTYEELNKSLPRIGDEVEAADGLKGDIEHVNILRQRVRIIVEVNDEKELHEYDAKDVTILHRRGRGQAKPKFNRNEKNNDRKSQDRTKNEGRNDQAERQERGERNDRNDRADRNDRSDRQERGDRQRGNRNDRGDRNERNDRSDRTERGDRNDRGDRPDRNDRQDRNDRSDRAEGQDNNRQGRGSRRNGGGNGANAEGGNREDGKNHEHGRRNRRGRQGRGPARDNASSEGENRRPAEERS